MKKTIFYMLAGIVTLAACEKNTFQATERTSSDGKALVKIGMFSMPITATPQLVYDNGVRISSAFSAPYPYPGGGYNTGGGTGGDYFALTPGSHHFEFWTTNPGTTNLVTRTFETTQDFEANKRWTLYIADTAANEVAIKAPDDGVASADSGFATIRFINLIPNSGAVDFYQNSTLLKANIPYKQFTEFFKIPSGSSDTFAIRPAGATPGFANTALAFYKLGINTNKRILSMVARGYFGTTDTQRKPNVSVAVNQ